MSLAIKNRLVEAAFRFVHSKKIAIVVAVTSGIYLSVADIYGDTTGAEWIRSLWLFIPAIAIPNLLLFLKGISGKRHPLGDDKLTIEVLEDHIRTTEVMLEVKTRRFREILEENDLSTSGSEKKCWQKFVVPKLDFSVVAREVVSFIESNFAIDKDNTNITIFGKSPQGKWQKLFVHQINWKETTTAETVMEWRNSTASIAYTKQQPMFVASKIDSKNKDEYVMTQRDKELGQEGSIYAHPLYIWINKNQSYDYVICISTYREKLSEPYDVYTHKKITELFSKFCRRYELELILHTANEIKNNGTNN